MAIDMTLPTKVVQVPHHHQVRHFDGVCSMRPTKTVFCWTNNSNSQNNIVSTGTRLTRARSTTQTQVQTQAPTRTQAQPQLQPRTRMPTGPTMSQTRTGEYLLSIVVFPCFPPIRPLTLCSRLLDWASRQDTLAIIPWLVPVSEPKSNNKPVSQQ